MYHVYYKNYYPEVYKLRFIRREHRLIRETTQQKIFKKGSLVRLYLDLASRYFIKLRTESIFDLKTQFKVERERQHRNIK